MSSNTVVRWNTGREGSVCAHHRDIALDRPDVEFLPSLPSAEMCDWCDSEELVDILLQEKEWRDQCWEVCNDPRGQPTTRPAKVDVNGNIRRW